MAGNEHFVHRLEIVQSLTRGKSARVVNGRGAGRGKQFVYCMEVVLLVSIYCVFVFIVY